MLSNASSTNTSKHITSIRLYVYIKFNTIIRFLQVIYLIAVFDGLSIMTSFLAGFVHLDKGVLCSDSGFMDLSTAQECSGAVSYAKSFNSGAWYNGEVDWASRPKGCFILAWGTMYFNKHSTGGRQGAIPICRKGNT